MGGGVVSIYSYLYLKGVYNFCLFSIHQNTVNVYINGVNVDTNLKKVDNNSQSKVKESKINKSKVNDDGLSLLLLLDYLINGMYRRITALCGTQRGFIKV